MPAGLCRRTNASDNCAKANAYFSYNDGANDSQSYKQFPESVAIECQRRLKGTIAPLCAHKGRQPWNLCNSFVSQLRVLTHGRLFVAETCLHARRLATICQIATETWTTSPSPITSNGWLGCLLARVIGQPLQTPPRVRALQFDVILCKCTAHVLFLF